MNRFRLLVGDVRDRLRELPAESVQCVVTSPPYWGLRDYGTGRWDGGDPACDHRASTPSRTANPIATSGLDGSKATCHASIIYGAACGRCGALRIDRQLGLERTPEEYVANMVDVFREVRRVLRPDGTLWLNLGDSYSKNESSNGGYSAASTLAGFTNTTTKGRTANDSGERRALDDGLPAKNLVGIPWRVAFALQADGWWLRSDIVWSKPNPMPESVTDRPTTAHEYLFLLTKSERYFYDADAIAETSIHAGRVVEYDGTQKNCEAAAQPIMRTRISSTVQVGETRNRRTVWTIATQPFPGAHFAVMPQALVEPCILAGSKSGDTILDPFAGSGTVGVVALKRSREFVGIDLNPTYAAMAKARIEGDAPLFNVEGAA